MPGIAKLLAADAKLKVGGADTGLTLIASSIATG